MSTAQHTEESPSVYDLHTDAYVRNKALAEEHADEIAAAFPAVELSPEDETAMHRQYVAGRLADLSTFVLGLAIGKAELGDKVNTYGLTLAEYVELARAEMARRGLTVPSLIPQRLAK